MAIPSSVENVTANSDDGAVMGATAADKIAFNGATPLVQQTGVAVSDAGVHAALVALGLITA